MQLNGYGAPCCVKEDCAFQGFSIIVGFLILQAREIFFSAFVDASVPGQRHLQRCHTFSCLCTAVLGFNTHNLSLIITSTPENN